MLLLSQIKRVMKISSDSQYREYKRAVENIKQKEAAQKLGISESRISELLSGKRALNLNMVKRLRDNFGISADFILDNM